VADGALAAGAALRILAPSAATQPLFLQSMTPAVHPLALALAFWLPLAPGAQAQTPAPRPGLPVAADNCEGIRLHIEGRLRAGGVPNPALVVLPRASAPGGRVLGSCGNGNRQIVYTGTAPGLPPERAPDRAPERPADSVSDKIPTECKDGSIVIGPRCDDPRAVRMSPAEIASSTASSPGRAASQ